VSTLHAQPDGYIVDADDWMTVQTSAEESDRNLVLDHLTGGGIVSGLDLTQQSSPNLTLQLSAGVAYDPLGRRLNVAAPVTVNLAVDASSVSTAVTSGNERYVAVYIRFRRTQEDAWTSNGTTYYLTQAESYEVVVVAGASAALNTGVVPAAPSGNPILLGRVKLVNGTTAILTTDVRLVGVPQVHRAEDIYTASVQRYLEVSTADPPNMTVVVAPGKVIIDDVYYAYAGGTTPTFTAPSSNPRIDLIALDSAGALVVRAGTEASSPTRPSAKGLLPIAFVSLAVSQTKIVDANLVDARPFLRANTTARRHHEVVATAAQTAFTLPFSYTTGAHALTVIVDGAVLAESEYTETSATVVTLASMTGGEVVTFFADESAALETVALQQVTDRLSGLALMGDVACADTGSGLRVYVDPVALCVLNNISYAMSGGYDLGATGLTSNTWYYVYLNVASGVLVASMNTTAPQTGRVWRDDSQTTPTHRFVTAVRSTSGGSGRAMRRAGPPGAGGVVLYDRCALGATALNVLTSGSDNTWTTVDLSDFIPPYARHALIELEVVASASNNAGAEVRTYGGTGGGKLVLTSETVSDAQTLRREAWVLTDSSRRLQYQRVSGYAGSVNIRVLGYRD
jgi:hypothetical protein